MKSILSDTRVLPALLTALLASSGCVRAATDSTQITVTAKVLAATCTAPVNPTYDIGNVSLTDLTAAGNETGKKDFTLDFTGCDNSITKIELTAAGTADSDDGNVFKNSAPSSPATKVGIVLYPDGKSTPLTPQGGTYEYTFASGTTHSLPMTARVKATATGATAGSVQAVIPLTVTYP